MLKTTGCDVIISNNDDGGAKLFYEAIPRGAYMYQL